MNAGSYQDVGSFNDAYNGVNTTGGTITVTSIGGGGLTCGGGGDYALGAMVNSVQVAYAVDNQPDWAKTGMITFAVPPTGSFSIYSNPYSCGGQMVGKFTVFIYS